MPLLTLAPDLQECVESSLGLPVHSIQLRCDLPSSATQGRGVLALASGPRLVRLSPCWFRLPECARLAVLAHELVHCVQLARGGRDDPVEELELEAWEAAPAVLSGRKCVILGRSTRHLAATAFIQKNLGSLPSSYYAVGRCEPLPAGKVLQVTARESWSGSAVSLLDAIGKRCKSGDSVIVVCHAFEGGLLFPICGGTQKDFTSDRMGVISSLLEHRANEKQRDIFERKLLSYLEADRLRRRNVEQLLEATLNVRKLKLGAVHIRGCNLGRYNCTLLALKKMLGCGSVTAPNLAQWFCEPLVGVVGVGRLGKVVGQRTGRPGEQAECSFVGTSKLRVRAETRAAVRKWFCDHFQPPSATVVTCLRLQTSLASSFMLPYLNGRANPAFVLAIQEATPPDRYPGLDGL